MNQTPMGRVQRETMLNQLRSGISATSSRVLLCWKIAHACSSSLLIFCVVLIWETRKLGTSLHSTGVCWYWFFILPDSRAKETVWLERTWAQSATAHMGIWSWNLDNLKFSSLISPTIELQFGGSISPSHKIVALRTVCMGKGMASSMALWLHTAMIETWSGTRKDGKLVLFWGSECFHDTRCGSRRLSLDFCFYLLIPSYSFSFWSP